MCRCTCAPACAFAHTHACLKSLHFKTLPSAAFLPFPGFFSSETGGSGTQNEQWTKNSPQLTIPRFAQNGPWTRGSLVSEPDPVPSCLFDPGRAAGNARARLFLMCRMRVSEHSGRRGTAGSAQLVARSGPQKLTRLPGGGRASPACASCSV